MLASAVVRYQLECVYKDEHYSVRDNGAVLRHARKCKSLRKNKKKSVILIKLPDILYILCIHK